MFPANKSWYGEYDDDTIEFSGEFGKRCGCDFVPLAKEVLRVDLPVGERARCSGRTRAKEDWTAGSA